MNRTTGFLIMTTTVLLSVAAYSQGLPDLTKLYRNLDRSADPGNARGPLIGVSAGHADSSSHVNRAYTEPIIKAGGVPVILPVTRYEAVLRDMVRHLDGLVMIGGGDVDPHYYREEPIPDMNDINPDRDIYDLLLIRLATDRNIPTLGICRGVQLINVAFGGTLYQDIPSQHQDRSVAHRQDEAREEGTHPVRIAPASKLASVLGQTEVLTNSFHHQAVRDVAPGFRTVATTSDGIVEAIEAYPDRSILGVQWHPEDMVNGQDSLMRNLFGHIVKEARLFHRAKALHKRILSVDTHTDAPLKFKMRGFDLGRRGNNQVNLPKMDEGMIDAVFFAAYISQGDRDDHSSRKAVERIDRRIGEIYAQAEKNKDLCGIARTREDLLRLKQEGKKAIFIGIENGYGIGKDIGNLVHFKSLGVSYMTLCHTKDNDICDSSCDTAHEWNGLSPFGREVIKEMNRLGILIDISHAGEKTVEDVLELSRHPVIASHSSVRALCNHNRNLTDEQMRAIARKGGVINICLVDRFINPVRSKASVSDAVRHIDHAVKTAGIDHVGIASDFDGGGGLTGCTGCNDMINLTVRLMEKGYSEEDLSKILGGNFLRVLSEIQKDTTTVVNHSPPHPG